MHRAAMIQEKIRQSLIHLFANTLVMNLDFCIIKVYLSDMKGICQFYNKFMNLRKDEKDHCSDCFRKDYYMGRSYHQVPLSDAVAWHALRSGGFATG